MKIDKDIQENVADEFCTRLDAGTTLPDAVHWAVQEMQRRQNLREVNQK